ncbi:hypothetical protein L1049_013587 [Liquidambar formosana]|uniref:Uncharacterized protein n=1 Tax=Liquidambar formosana TaxID=63359 RepID=A0AAP0RLN8_LIQFO
MGDIKIGFSGDIRIGINGNIEIGINEMELKASNSKKKQQTRLPPKRGQVKMKIFKLFLKSAGAVVGGLLRKRGKSGHNSDDTVMLKHSESGLFVIVNAEDEKQGI